MEEYEFIRAIVDCGELRWEYRLKGSHVTGRQAHDEDVTDWTEEQIVQLTCDALDVSEAERGVIQVEFR